MAVDNDFIKQMLNEGKAQVEKKNERTVSGEKLVTGRNFLANLQHSLENGVKTPITNQFTEKIKTIVNVVDESTSSSLKDAPKHSRKEQSIESSNIYENRGNNHEEIDRDIPDFSYEDMKKKLEANVFKKAPAQEQVTKKVMNENIIPQNSKLLTEQIRSVLKEEIGDMVNNAIGETIIKMYSEDRIRKVLKSIIQESKKK